MLNWLIDSFIIYCFHRLYKKLDSGWRCSLQYKQLWYIIGSLKLQISVKCTSRKLFHVLSTPIAVIIVVVVDAALCNVRREERFRDLRVVLCES